MIRVLTLRGRGGDGRRRQAQLVASRLRARVVAVELRDVQTLPTPVRTARAKDGLVVDTKLGFPLVVLSEVGNNRVGVSAVRVPALQGAASAHVGRGRQDALVRKHHVVGLRWLRRLLHDHAVVICLLVAHGRVGSAVSLWQWGHRASREHAVVRVALESCLVHLSHRGDSLGLGGWYVASGQDLGAGVLRVGSYASTHNGTI